VLAEAYDCPHATDNSILASISSNTNIESSYEVGGQKIGNRWSCVNFKLYCQLQKKCAFGGYFGPFSYHALGRGSGHVEYFSQPTILELQARSDDSDRLGGGCCRKYDQNDCKRFAVISNCTFERTSLMVLQVAMRPKTLGSLQNKDPR
jgi:hypothetical protein